MSLSDLGRARLSWLALGTALAALVGFITYSFVGTFVVALFIYYATRPVYNQLSQRIRPPSVAAALSLLVLALPVLLLIGYALAIGVQEFNKVAQGTNFGPVEATLGPYRNVTTSVQDPATLLNDPNLADAVGGLLDTGLDYLGFVGTGLLHLFVMLAIAFYLLRDGPRLGRWVMRFSDEAGVLDRYARAVDRDLYRVFSGNIFNALFTAAIGAIIYSVLDFLAPAGAGVPYPALIGLLAGAASLVPVVGMKIVYVPVAGYLFGAAYLSPDPNYTIPVAFALLSFVVVDTIPDLVLRPYVSGRNLHVGLVMFAYIFGPLLFGWYGIFLGPLLLVLVVHFGRIVLPELVSGTEIRPFAVDPGASPTYGDESMDSVDHDEGLPGDDKPPGEGDDRRSDRGDDDTTGNASTP